MRIYQAEIAEKILLQSEELTNFKFFKLGGKIMFDDLSVLKYINNLNFIEKQIPKGIQDSIFIISSLDKETSDSKELLKGLNSTGLIKYPLLILKSSAQVMAEGDHRDIYILPNEECAFESFDSMDYTFYDKQKTKDILMGYNIEPHILFKKMTNDFEQLNISTKIKEKSVIKWRP